VRHAGAGATGTVRRPLVTSARLHAVGGIVLVVPSTAVAAAWAQLPDKDHPVLEVLLNLPVAVVDNLDAIRARAVGALGGDQPDAHALLCARDRGYPLITADAARYAGIRPAGVEVDQLP
jgi:hypothetical protein